MGNVDSLKIVYQQNAMLLSPAKLGRFGLEMKSVLQHLKLNPSVQLAAIIFVVVTR